jgi:hypothetical protein
MRTEPAGVLTLYWRLWGWLALIPLAIAAVAGLIALGQAGQTALSPGQVEVMASVENAWESRGKRNADGSSSFFATFVFLPPGSPAQVVVRRQVDRDFYLASASPRTVPVRFYEWDPETIEIAPFADTGTSGTALPPAGIAVASGLAGLLLARRSATRAAQAIRAREKGERRRMEVSQVIPTGVTINGRSQFRIAWAGEDGVKGQSLMADQSAFGDLGPGSDITVYVPPGGKGDSWWEGDIGPRKGGFAAGAAASAGLTRQAGSAGNTPPANAGTRPASPPKPGKDRQRATGTAVTPAQARRETSDAAPPRDPAAPREAASVALTAAGTGRRDSSPKGALSGGVVRRLTGARAGRPVGGRWTDGPAIRR